MRHTDREIARILVKRGGRARLVSETAARAGLRANERVVYSTEGRDAVSRKGRYIGECPASDAIRAGSSLEATSGRTKFYGNGQSLQKPSIRVFGEIRKK